MFNCNTLRRTYAVIPNASFRCMSTQANKLTQIIQGEIQHEKTNYEVPPMVKKFLKESEWKFADKDNEVNMTITKEQDGNVCVLLF